MKVFVEGTPLGPICSHASTVMDNNKIIIFGGYNFENNFNPKLRIL